MNKTDRARMQARIVLVVYRAEMARLARLDLSPADRLEFESTLQRAKLGPSARDGGAKRHLEEALEVIPNPGAA